MGGDLFNSDTCATVFWKPSRLSDIWNNYLWKAVPHRAITKAYTQQHLPCKNLGSPSLASWELMIVLDHTLQSWIQVATSSSPRSLSVAAFKNSLVRPSCCWTAAAHCLEKSLYRCQSWSRALLARSCSAISSSKLFHLEMIANTHGLSPTSHQMLWFAILFFMILVHVNMEIMQMSHFYLT